MMRVRGRTLLLGALGATGVAAVTGAIWIALPISSSLTRDGGQGVTIEDRNGIPLRSTRAGDGSKARWVPYDRIDPDLINAFVAVEDRRFWDHHGVDAMAVGRAIRDNLRARQIVSGASTISMQLARLLRPAERSWSAKVAQTLLALRLEAHLSKQQILEQYLNRVGLGQGTVGVAAATALYFDTSPSEVSIGQAATLAGLAHAPSRDNPHVSLVRARTRRALALARMHRMGFATRTDVARARDEPLVSGSRRAPFLAPHFTTRVLAWTAAERDSTRIARIRTSLDVGLQTELEAEVRHTVSVLNDRGVGQAAVVVLNNASGEVLGWVGSPDFWASENGQTDMVVSPRQPGSALKPFLYGLALDRGVTAATVLPDIPKSYATAIGAYRPRDYDRRFRGPVRAREALASSYNVPAVELASRFGASSLLQTLHLAGFTSLTRDADYYGIGLALGNGDVSLLELANAYRALANGGEWRPWSWRPVSPARPVAADAPARHVPGRECDHSRHPQRSRGTHAGVRLRDAVRFPLSGCREDRHQPSLHRQLGRGHHGWLHRRRVGRQLQRPSDGRSERRNRRRAAPPSRGHGCGPADTGGRAHYAGGSWRHWRSRMPSLGHACNTALRQAQRMVRTRYRADARGRLGARRSHHSSRRVCRLGARGTVPCHRRASQGRVDSREETTRRHRGRARHPETRFRVFILCRRSTAIGMRFHPGSTRGTRPFHCARPGPAPIESIGP